MPLFGGITALASLGFAGYQYGKSRIDKRRADADFEKSMRNRAGYQTPASVNDVAADARGRLNAQDPAIQLEQQAIDKQAASQAGYAQRNASSGAQAIQAAADANAQTYSILPQLAQQDTAYRQQNINNYYNTQAGLTEDARLKHSDALEANNLAANVALGRVGAAQSDGSQALALGVQSLGSLASSGMQGGFRMPRTKITSPAIQPAGNAMMPLTAARYTPSTMAAVPNNGLNSYLSNRLYQPYSFGSY